MLALAKGRYQPAEVRTGLEADGRTEILAGLSEGEKVVTSGQFLIDSEASLSAMEVRPISGTATPPASKAKNYTATGQIEKIASDSVTLKHGPVPALGWPAMTMSFRLGDPATTKGFKAGDKVRFTFDQPPEGPTVRFITRESGQ
jgi:Cu(I)/Ag(I) efflux system membrane fusion protein